MADGFDIDAVIAQHAAPKGKASPAADDGFDINAAIQSAPTDVGPAARRVAAGKAPEPAAPADEVTLQPTEDPAITRHRERATEDNPFAGDPLARGIAGGIVGMGVGSLVGAGAAAAGAPVIIGRTAAGAAAGATSAAVTGDNIKAGAALGAAIPLVSGVAKVMKGATGSDAQQFFKRIGQTAPTADRLELEKLGEKKLTEVLQKHGAGDIGDPRAAIDTAKANVEGELKAAQSGIAADTATREAENAAAAWNALPPEERLFRQVGQLVGKAEKPRVVGLGKDTVAGALQRAGVTTLDNPQQAAAAISAARAQIGKNIGGAYDAIDATGAGTKLGDAMNALDTYRGTLEASTATKQLAGHVRQFMKDFAETHGTNPDAVIPTKLLNQEIGALERDGFAGRGSDLSQASSAQLGRGAAKALNGLLDDEIAAAAKSNPAAAEAAKNLGQWNKDFRVMKTIEKPIAGRAAALRFAPPASPPPLPETATKLDLAQLAQTHGPLVDEYKALRITSDALARESAAKTFGPSGLERLGNTPGAVASALAGKTAMLPIRAAAAPFSAADAAIARLFSAKASGTLTPQLVAAASAAGVAPNIIRHFVAHADRPTMTLP
jgi:hypothetical protein